MNKQKKIVFTLNIGDYCPELTEITYPYMEKYAKKIDASFHIIRERKFFEYPITYEKLQIRDIMLKEKADWAIFLDSDALVHPDMFDITNHISKDTVMHYATDLASNRWKYDEYFLRDGRNIGSCNWFAVASDWCLDLWQPLDIPLEEAISNISLAQMEVNAGIFDPTHLIDDYTVSRNIAKYGLKTKTFLDLCNDLVGRQLGYFWHDYAVSEEEKVRMAKEVITEWETEVHNSRPILDEQQL